jgi:hypothetical protein
MVGRQQTHSPVRKVPDLLMELAQFERRISLEMQFKLMWARRLETAAACTQLGAQR